MKLRSINSVTSIVIGLVAIVAGACGSGEEPAAAPETGATATAIIVNPPESSSATTTDTPVPGSTDGTFVVGEGSEATFTVNEKLSSLPLPNDAVMRTGGVTGEIDLSAGTASLVIDLRSLRSDSTRRDRYIRNQLFPSQPSATITVSKFPDIPEEFAEGESFIATVMETVNVNGTDAEIEFEIESRLDPDRLLVLVTGDFTWADFGISAPTSRTFVVKDDVHVEVLVSAVPK
jgi:hypothetical protein